jgi:glyoxylase-like metal-dependent hydrolase (beta-lactamase superfamily II)
MAAIDRMRRAPDRLGNGYEVTAIRCGTLRSAKSKLFHRYGTYGEPDAEIEMAYYLWLLRDGERVVLVDTGFDPAVAARRGRTVLVEPIEALRRLDVRAAAVSAVVVTHFHYDHIGNLAAFPAAELIVPRRELDFWTGPLAGRPQFAAHVEAAEIEEIAAAAEEGRVRTTEGEEEILPGVTAIEVGGHSPGQQLTVIAGEGGTVLLTSDAVHFYEELELDRPFAVLADLAAMYAAYDRVSELARGGAIVVAGHDPAVMERFPPDGAEAGLAVRVDRPLARLRCSSRALRRRPASDRDRRRRG